MDASGRDRALLSVNAAPLFDAGGKIDGMVVTVEDITARLALEAQLRQSQKMESVGQLAAGVAHDINNILTIIQGHAGLLLNVASLDADSVKSLKQISAASERAAGFIRHLLMFSRKQVYRTKILDLNAVLHNLESMLPRMLGEHIALEIRCGPDLPRIAADVAMIEQIVMNLAVNARDAMPKGGKLLIETSAVEITADYVQLHPEAHAGRFVCLTVTDTGCGMERSVCSGFLNHFLPPRKWAREPAWDWPPFMASSNNITAGSRSRARSGQAPPSRCSPCGEAAICPVPLRIRSQSGRPGNHSLVRTKRLLDCAEVLEQYHYRV